MRSLLDGLRELGTDGLHDMGFSRDLLWLLMVTTKELGTCQPVDVLSMGDGVLGALVMAG
jgi:hypothetical protein